MGSDASVPGPPLEPKSNAVRIACIVALLWTFVVAAAYLTQLRDASTVVAVVSALVPVALAVFALIRGTVRVGTGVVAVALTLDLAFTVALGARYYDQKWGSVSVVTEVQFEGSQVSPGVARIELPETLGREYLIVDLLLSDENPEQGSCKSVTRLMPHDEPGFATVVSGSGDHQALVTAIPEDARIVVVSLYGSNERGTACPVNLSLNDAKLTNFP